MTVLLIVSIPDEKRNPDWFANADTTGIRAAVHGLAVAAKWTEVTIVVADNPAIISLLMAILPASQLRIVQRGAEPVFANIRRAFLIGGCDKELDMARRVHAAEIRVVPIASTGAAALAFLKEIAHNGDLTADDATDLVRNLAYAKLFERLLLSS